MTIKRIVAHSGPSQRSCTIPVNRSGESLRDDVYETCRDEQLVLLKDEAAPGILDRLIGSTNSVRGEPHEGQGFTPMAITIESDEFERDEHDGDALQGKNVRPKKVRVTRRRITWLGTMRPTQKE